MIDWQNGALGTGAERKAPNGAFVEDVLFAAMQRLEHYQEGKFQNNHNAIAILKIQEALAELDARTTDRQRRSVEGTHEV